MLSLWRSLCRYTTSPYLAALMLFAVVMFFIMTALAFAKAGGHNVFGSMQSAKSSDKGSNIR